MTAPKHDGCPLTEQQLEWLRHPGFSMLYDSQPEVITRDPLTAILAAWLVDTIRAQAEEIAVLRSEVAEGKRKT